MRNLGHAIGPERAARLPGWCGNSLLTSAEVRRSLTQVERALSFTPEARAAADAQLEWLECRPDEESLIDGPLRIWRHAATAGLGLIGLNLHIN